MGKNLLIAFIFIIVSGTANSKQCLGKVDCSNFGKPYQAQTFISESSPWQVVLSEMNAATSFTDFVWGQSATAVAETYSLTITAKNVNGVAKSAAEVILYDDSKIEYSTATTNSLGQATFSNLVNGTYTYKVFYKPSIPNVPVTDNKEFWGSRTITINNSNVSETFTRNAPYISVGPTFNPSYLPSGQQTIGSFTVKNPLPSPAESFIAVWIDRDKLSAWDYISNDPANAKPISVGGTSAFPFNVTPINDGSYSCYAFVYSKIDGTYIITDQYDWAEIFTVAPIPTISQITWSGYTWKVRSGIGGPGPNKWNASPSNIWVDDLGNLHLKIIKIGNNWYCSEITLLQSLGYGAYTFQVATNVEKLDKNIVLGLFTYETGSREIDIEFSRWGNAASVDGWYTIQPQPYNNLNQKSFPLNLSGDYSTHQFKWTSSEIYFQSDYGHGVDNLINKWTYKGVNNPPAGEERLHLNLWLFNGNAPSNLQEAEVIIKSFKYLPNPISSSIKEFSDSNKIVLFPNPTKGLVNISADHLIEGNSTIEVYNNTGLLVESKCISLNKNTAQIDMSAYSNGHYLVKIDIDNQSFYRKILKE
ncbi:MAG TPA: T9SS type A sorting domain-containing protein [Prolixibacteraceae bacterium]|jgi:hypothetical protein